ncbi:MAG: ribonuclease R [Alphaproteobacteria bacterium]|nr:ribonuclease R [Alphaproteobacteria bacterium]
MTKNPRTKKPSKKPAKSAFPSNEDILKFIEDSPGRVGKREIARAFKLDAKQKMTLKKVLREMQQTGLLEKDRGKRVRKHGALPPVMVLRITGPDIDGELLARPDTWDGDGEPPIIYMAPDKRRPNSPGVQPGTGDRVLARLTPTEDGALIAHTIRTIAAAPEQVLGIFETVEGPGNNTGRVRPTNRRTRGEFVIDARDTLDAKPGDLVRAEPLPGRKLGLRQARIVERIEADDSVHAPSMIAIADYGLPTRFSDQALKQADKAAAAPAKGRDDFRDIPLVTIDGPDARDFDDAVWAEPDTDKYNPGGWHLLVAIADVSWYVRPGDALDTGAYERGNSVYFPDRVVPMLPEVLSNGWCSLVPHEDRPCMAAHLWIDADGNLLRHKFRRGTMRSKARLTYAQAQAARDGNADEITKPLMATVINPLYGAYAALQKNRETRGVLELDMPERKVELSPDGTVEAISVRQRLDSHKLIEEFMICANVAAAQTLEKAKMPCLYRVHDEPSHEKLAALGEVLSSVNISFEKGGVASPKRFNRVLKLAAGTPHAEMINVMVLRSQSQAEYAPGNLGHFGLALRRYCHFTSPIRRYADLLVHRALIDANTLGEGGLGKAPPDFEETGKHLSETERRAAGAERDAVDRFTAAYLADRIGALFQGRINGVTRFGLFITLIETGADGLIPIRTLPDDYYIHDEDRHSLRGRRSGREYLLGQPVEIRLAEASPVTGGMIFSLMETGESGETGTGRQKGRRNGRSKGKPPGGRAGRGGKPKKTGKKGGSRGNRKAR